MFSLTCAWINSWVNNREAGDLGCHCAHYDVTVMFPTPIIINHSLIWQVQPPQHHHSIFDASHAEPDILVWTKSIEAWWLSRYWLGLCRHNVCHQSYWLGMADSHIDYVWQIVKVLSSWRGEFQYIFIYIFVSLVLHSEFVPSTHERHPRVGDVFCEFKLTTDIPNSQQTPQTHNRHPKLTTDTPNSQQTSQKMRHGMSSLEHLIYRSDCI